MGPKKALPWGKILPAATTNAVDLISQMMQMSPWQRITAAEALKHAYVEEYYDPPNEPDCPVFTFDKNLDSMSKEGLQEEILREIDSIHDSVVKNLVNGDTNVIIGGDSEKTPVVKMDKSVVDHQVNDVEMLSAKFEDVSVAERSRGNQICTEAENSNKSLTESDSKSKLRAALLNAMKNKGATVGGNVEPECTGSDERLTGCSKAAVTAQTRYLERLEKRKRRQERREEKTRKSREKTELRYNASIVVRF